MGVFSWITQDTGESIPSTYSSRKPFTVYMLDNKGSVWKEDNYEGYGVFGGKDFFELLSEMNGLTTRDEGIELFFGGEPFLSPNLFQEEGHKWVNSCPKDCPNQGSFYVDEEDEEDED